MFGLAHPRDLLRHPNYKDPDVAELLGRLAPGGFTAALVVPFSADTTSFRATVRAEGDGILRGRVSSVAGALDADVLVVPASTDAGSSCTRLRRLGQGSASSRPSPWMTRQLADLLFAAGAPRCPPAAP